jgi:hypothetical protein
MIPELLDDGFTVEIDEICCRPMIHGDKVRWKQSAFQDPEEAHQSLLAEPYSYIPPGVVLVPETEKKLVRFILGYSAEQEAADLQALSDAVGLRLMNPGLSELSCNDCQRYSVDHSTGEIQRYPDGTPKAIPGAAKVPCETQFGCLKGHYSRPRTLVGRWGKTWRHFWRHRYDPEIFNCPLMTRNRTLLVWMVDYGRDRRFDPFAGGEPERRSASHAEVTTGTGGS